MPRPVGASSRGGGAVRSALLGLGFVVALPVIGLASLAAAGVRGVSRLAAHGPRRRPAGAQR